MYGTVEHVSLQFGMPPTDCVEGLDIQKLQ